MEKSKQLEFFLQPSYEYFKEFAEREKLKLSLFERLCKISPKILKAPGFLRKKLYTPIWLTDMKVTPDEVFSFSIISLLVSLLIFLPLSLLDVPNSLIFLIFPPFIFYNVLFYPNFFSEVLKIRAGNESVSIILYMVTYLSFTPVYENAIFYAASRCHGPLGNDLKRAIWKTLSGEYPTIRQALAAYGEKWTIWNEEFVNTLTTLQLIETAVSPEDRNEILRVATERMLTRNSKKMEEYAEKLKTPTTLLAFFGIMLPLMGLVMFPLVSIFLGGYINPLYIGIGYTVILPFFLWWFLYRLISKRPGVYAHTEKIEEVSVKRYIEFKRIKIPIIPLAILIGFLITIPGLLYFFELYSLYISESSKGTWGNYVYSMYSPEYILKDTFRAMFVVWGIGFAIIFLTYFRTKGPFEFDKFIRNLEGDFEYGLFELHSALQQNVPMETAILKVVKQYERIGKKDSPIAIFFLELYKRLIRLTKTLKEILFGKEGLVTYLPSSLIKNVMGIVSSALTKGTFIASNVAKNIAYYLSRLREIDDKINKSVSDIVSSLEMQSKLIAPFISAIVAGASVIIIQLLQAVAKTLQYIEEVYKIGTNIGGTMSNVLGLINLQQVMPPTLMEVIAGIYLIESIIIIVFFSSGISKGFNKVYREYITCRVLASALILFTIIFFILVLFFQPIVTRIGVT
jgi:uncharacterized membrane protein